MATMCVSSRAPFTGIDIPPRWRIVPPGRPVPRPGTVIVLEPGEAFGTGTHPSTRLSLQAIAAFAPRDGRDWRMLDFGSGTGILSIGAAKLGATVAAVEIDPQALETSRQNAARNGVGERIRVAESLAGVPGPFDLVVANVLRGVLWEFAPQLAERLSPDGTLVLAGLVHTDVPDLSVRYAPLLAGRRPEVYRHGEWCALAWRTGQAVGG